MGGFTAGDDGDGADERHQQQHASRFDGHEMPTEQFAAQPRHMVLCKRVDHRRDRSGGGGRGRVDCGWGRNA